MLKGPHIVFAYLVAVHPEFVGSPFPDKEPNAIHDNHALALGHRVQPQTPR